MRAIGIDNGEVLTSSDVPEFEIGTRVHHSNKEYIYVEADEALAAGDACIVMEDYGASQLESTISAAGTGQGMPVGLCVAAIASGGFGWLQIYGVGDVNLNVGSSCAVHTQLTSSSSAGRVDDATTSGLEVVDGLVTTGAESSNAAACWLNYPTVGRTL
jgi:hypothetical protein